VPLFLPARTYAEQRVPYSTGCRFPPQDPHHFADVGPLFILIHARRCEDFPFPVVRRSCLPHSESLRSMARILEKVQRRRLDQIQVFRSGEPRQRCPGCLMLFLGGSIDPGTMISGARPFSWGGPPPAEWLAQAYLQIPVLEYYSILRVLCSRHETEKELCRSAEFRGGDRPGWLARLFCVSSCFSPMTSRDARGQYFGSRLVTATASSMRCPAPSPDASGITLQFNGKYVSPGSGSLCPQRPGSCVHFDPIRGPWLCTKRLI